MLNIKAEDNKDLEVISTLLQDATFRVKDLAYEANTHQFAGLANRFKWEKNNAKKAERVRSILRLEHVLKTSFKNIPFNVPNHVLNFLSLECNEENEGTKTIIINFSGFASIRLEVELLELFLEDVSESWKTKTTPHHEILEQTEKE